jgi:hypothetical protein
VNRELIGGGIIGALGLGFIIMIIVGITKCSTTHNDVVRVTDVNTEYVAYYEAEYSDRYYDFMSESWKTDYWDEPASEVYRVITHNNKLVKTNAKYVKGLKCEKPIKYTKIKTIDLDGVYFRNYLTLKMRCTLDGKFNTIRLNQKEYDYVSKHVGDNILVSVNGFGTINKILIKK